MAWLHVSFGTHVFQDYLLNFSFSVAYGMCYVHIITSFYFNNTVLHFKIQYFKVVNFVDTFTYIFFLEES